MKKIVSLILVLVLVMACAVGFAGCGGGGGQAPAGGDAEQTDAPASGNPVVTIGVYEPASGDNGAGGKQETLGIQYANFVQPTVEINGVTYDVKLKIVDNESSNDKAASAASDLVSAGCSVVLGSYGSGVSIAGGPTFEAAGIPVIGITCTNPQVTEGNDYYFRICYLDPFQGTVLANYAYNQLGVDKAFCLSKLGDDYSGGLVNYFVDAFEALGGTCIEQTFPEGNSDFTSYIATAQSENCGVFFSPVSTEAAQLIVDQADAQGMAMPILAGDTWDSNVILQAASGKNVNITVTTFYQEGGDPAFDAGVKEWINSDSANLSNNGGDDTIAAVTAMGYDAYFVALAAMQKAGSTDPADVMAALWDTTYDGVSGAIAFDEIGDAIRDVAYVKTANVETGAWDFVTVQGVE